MRLIVTVATMVIVVYLAGCEQQPVTPVPIEEATPAADASESAADAPSLTVGDAAPSLSIADFVHGEGVDDFSADTVYVVEFWATWCPPCRASMPHVSQLQEKYGSQVRFVGVTREDADTVSEFLAKDHPSIEDKTWSEVVGYTLALDEDSKTSDAYMRAAGQNGIPTAFIVGRDGHIEWIGHPMSIDGPLEEIVAGQWDRAAFAARFQAEQRADLALDEVRSLMVADKLQEAIDRIDQLLADDPDNAVYRQYRAVVLMQAERFAEAQAALAEVADAFWGDAQQLNSIAWTMVTRIPQEQMDLKRAMEIAERANELTHGDSASIVDTLARVAYESGDLDRAIELQRRAVELDGGSTPSIGSALERYEAAHE